MAVSKEETNIFLNLERKQDEKNNTAKNYYYEQMVKAGKRLKEIDEEIYMLKLSRKAVREKQIKMAVRYNDLLEKPIVDLFDGDLDD